MYDNVWEEKKDGYGFNWPPNVSVADTNHSKLLRASREQLGMPVWRHCLHYLKLLRQLTIRVKPILRWQSW